MSQSSNKNRNEIEEVGKAESTMDSRSSRSNDITYYLGFLDKKSFGSLIATIIFILGSCFIFSIAAKKTSTAYSDSYASAKLQASQEAYAKYEKMGYDKAEKKYHTSNRATINIDTLKEKNHLEVLSASDTYLNVIKESDIMEDSQRWVAIPGTAVYTVDMSMSEIIKDDYNEYILVRVKYPELSDITINYDKVETYLYVYNSLATSIEKGRISYDGTYKAGASEAQRDYAKAYSEMYERFYSDQKFYITAQDSARRIITSMVRNLNPEIPNLKVEVEFF